MKLTKAIRDAFIRSAMNDVPSKQANGEQIRKLVLDDMVNRLPPAVRKVWDDSNTRSFIKTDYNTYNGVNVCYPAAEQCNSWNKPALSPEVEAKVVALELEMKDDTQTRIALQSKIKAAAYGCTTRKQLVELLPEFEKYLPADEAKATKVNLPAVANLVSEFTKAGWPKKNASTV